jgi:Zn-finger nucleic acid-binding protein
MSEALRQTLKCPQCGAPLSPESVRETVSCAFCGTASSPQAAAATPGARIASETVAAAEERCPRCALPLFEGRANEITMLGCGRCGGIWLDNEAARRAIQTMDEAVLLLADQASSRAAFTVEVAGTAVCPTCQRSLARTRSPQSGIWIDVCPEHGTWFDRYELGVVLEALRPRTAPQPTTYDGPTPDFREGANPEIKQLAGILGYGVLGMLGAAAGLVAGSAAGAAAGAAAGRRQS